MNTIFEVLETKKDLFKLKGALEQEILFAEKKLGIEFSQDYRSLLKTYGAVSYEGHEIVGICSSARLNVVDVTITEKEKNNKVPEGMYVVEVANIDSIVIWQSESGEIYKSSMGLEPNKIYDSLVEYIYS